MAAVALSPTQQTWADSKLEESMETLTKTVRQYLRRFGGDFDTLWADALYLYCQAVLDWREQVEWSLHIRQWVYFGLVDLYRKEARHFRNRDVMFEDNVPANSVQPFVLTEFVSGCSDLAREVLELVIDPPDEIQVAANRRGGNPQNLRRCVREHLVDWGFASTEVSSAFNEIRELL